MGNYVAAMYSKLSPAQIITIPRPRNTHLIYFSLARKFKMGRGGEQSLPKEA
ncbi:unnamed protein product [marine sediment metagenome]|uniref:Uncharacterized protein n=1 Tax=marine sediment metagenome TaxID=412755 RepID=X1C986_9ZZZZ